MALFGRRETPAKPAEPETRENAQPRPMPRLDAPASRPAVASPGLGSSTSPVHAATPPVTMEPVRRPPAEGITAPSGPAALGATNRRTEERPMPVQAPAPSPAAAASSGDQDGKKLIVGKQIVLSGEIKACEKLIVEGRVEAALTDCHSIAILPDGLFKGAATIDIADISGRFEGDLVVRQRLMLRATGHIAGNVRYGEVEIERGGVIAGDMRPIADGETRQASHPGHGGANGGARGG
jgi:cytoskeletal protein CcmA (bactofilin family)